MMKNRKILTILVTILGIAFFVVYEVGFSKSYLKYTLDNSASPFHAKLKVSGFPFPADVKAKPKESPSHVYTDYPTINLVEVQLRYLKYDPENSKILNSGYHTILTYRDDLNKNSTFTITADKEGTISKHLVYVDKKAKIHKYRICVQHNDGNQVCKKIYNCVKDCAKPEFE